MTNLKIPISKNSRWDEKQITHLYCKTYKVLYKWPENIHLTIHILGIPVSECGAWARPIREMSVHICPMGGRRANLLTAALTAEIWTAACSYRGTVARCRAAAGKRLSLLHRCTLQEPPDYLTTSLLQVFALEYISGGSWGCEGTALTLETLLTERLREAMPGQGSQQAQVGRYILLKNKTQNCKFIALKIQHADLYVWDKKICHIHMRIMLFTSNYVELEHEINSKTVDFYYKMYTLRNHKNQYALALTVLILKWNTFYQRVAACTWMQTSRTSNKDPYQIIFRALFTWEMMEETLLLIFTN